MDTYFYFTDFTYGDIVVDLERQAEYCTVYMDCDIYKHSSYKCSKRKTITKRSILLNKQKISPPLHPILHHLHLHLHLTQNTSRTSSKSISNTSNPSNNKKTRPSYLERLKQYNKRTCLIVLSNQRRSGKRCRYRGKLSRSNRL